MDGLSKRGLIRVAQTDPDRIVITSEGVAAIGGNAEDETTAQEVESTVAANETAPSRSRARVRNRRS